MDQEKLWFSHACAFSLNSVSCYIPNSKVPGIHFQSESAAAFQMFANHNFGKKNTITVKSRIKNFVGQLQSAQNFIAQLFNTAWQTLGPDIFDTDMILPPAEVRYVPRTNLPQIKQRATQEIYPHVMGSNSSKCLIFLFTNLAQPEYIQVHCQATVLLDIFCSSTISSSNEQLSAKYQLPVTCPQRNVVINESCFLLKWHKGGECEGNINTLHHSLPLNMDYFKYFSNIFRAVSSPFLPLLSQLPTATSEVKVFIYKRVLNKDKYREDRVNISHASGFFVHLAKKIFLHTGGHIFMCENGSYVSFLYVCDGVIDCPKDMSDEANCTCNSYVGNTQPKCAVHSINWHFCSSLYYMALDGSCYLFTKHRSSLAQTSTKKLFTCNNGDQIDLSLSDDLVADCGPKAEDEPTLISILKHKKRHKCSNFSELPCLEHHCKCFQLDHICTYQLNQFNHLYPCRNGGHMYSCEQFECNAMFKCPLIYCIPWSYVCDGKWDCPQGNDESSQSVCEYENVCFQQYKCTATRRTCLLLGNICDGQTDCPHGDDETNCDLKGILCPFQCKCLLLAVFCEGGGIFAKSFERCYPYVSVALLHKPLQSIDDLAFNVPFASFVQLKSCGLSNICSQHYPAKITSINAAQNKISKLSQWCFGKRDYLQHIILQNNSLNEINSFSFGFLQRLSFLSLSHNNLLVLHRYAIPVYLTLKVLTVQNNHMTGINIEMFRSTHIQYVVTDNYHICCISLKHMTCTASRPWFISCSQLLPTKLLEIFFVLSAVFVLVANLVSLYPDSLKKYSHPAYALISICIKFNNICFFSFLFVIIAFHHTKKETFIVHEMQWRSGQFCFAAFLVKTFFTMSSLLSLILSSLSRFMVVAKPMHTKFKSKRYVSRILVFALLVSVSLTVALSLWTKLSHSMLPTNLCLPFSDPSKHHVSLYTFILVTCIGHSIASGTISALHVLIPKKVAASVAAVPGPINRKEEHTGMKVQLAILALSPILCWCPSDILFISLAHLDQYPMQLVYWAVAVVMPVNSILFPAVQIKMWFKKCQEKEKPGQSVLPEVSGSNLSSNVHVTQHQPGFRNQQ